PGIERVLAVVRSVPGQKHDKLSELVQRDLTISRASWTNCRATPRASFAPAFRRWTFEADYRHVTYDIAIVAAQTLVSRNAGMTFIFVSGAGTDATGKSRTMWARVKREAENAILQLPFKGPHVFRPAFIRPMHAITSRTGSYRVLYAIMRPLVPLLDALFPRYSTTTERVGRAMLNVARHGAPKQVLETEDINASAES
ncbi:MAG: epimerase, partial [Myxococcota bacterium]|nr:epimerase [Myxococcota bacterium]